MSSGATSVRPSEHGVDCLRGSLGMDVSPF